MDKLKSVAPTVRVAASRSYSRDSSCPQVSDRQLQATPFSQTAGRHFIVDFYGARHLANAEIIEKALTDAADAAKAVLLHLHIHTFSGAGGVTGVALLAESHISVHTWPERDYAAFDIFMCGNSLPENAVDLLKKVFRPERVELQEILRGQATSD